MVIWCSRGPAAVLVLALAALLAACGDERGAGPAAPAASADARRAAAAPEPLAAPVPVPEIAGRAGAGRPVIVVGLDGADWRLLDRYVERGSMPNLAGLRREGVHGELRSEHPPLSPLLWTTMMTGRSPLEHGILDFLGVDPASGEKSPIGSDSRRVPAIWNMATQGGRSVGVLGLWATYPAEPVAGTLVSDRLFSFLFVEGEPPPGTVYPAAREAWARQALDRAEAEIGHAQLREYLPWLDLAEYERRTAATDPYAHPVSALRRILVETRVYHELATSLLREQRPDLAIVYLQGTDTVGHVFAPYAPPRQPTVSEEDFARYGAVPERYFAAIDGLLGEYRDLARAAGATLVLVSDHGFLWDEGRPERLSSFAAATAGKWHRNEGIYLLWGEGIGGSGARGAAGGIRQVCATLLALLGLPPGRGVAGPPLPGALPPDGVADPVDYAAHYRPMPRRQLVARDRALAREELAKLQALGYLGAGEVAAASGPVSSPRTAASFNNEALILKDGGRLDEAERAFQQAIEIDPRYPSALWNYSDLLFARGADRERSDRLLLRAVAAGSPDGKRYLITRAMHYQQSGDTARALRLLEGGVAALPQDVEIRLFRGRYRIEQRDCTGALADFQSAIAADANRPDAHLAAGLAHLCLGEVERAREAFRRAAALDPDEPRLRQLLRETGG